MIFLSSKEIEQTIEHNAENADTQCKLNVSSEIVFVLYSTITCQSLLYNRLIIIGFFV